MPAKPFVIALEEHFQDPDVGAAYGPLDANRAPPMVRAAGRPWRAAHQGDGRGRHRPAGDVPLRPRRCRRWTPRPRCAWRALPTTGWREAVRAHPDRFAGFAALPTPDPKAAADELERAVTKLGFKGAMIHGLTHGVFHDDKRFWPIFERAAGARRADLLPSVGAAAGGDRRLLQDLSAGRARHPARRLGLHRGDRDAGRAHGAVAACSTPIRG